MASNFDFLEKIDKELYSIILDSEKLFRNEYFNQCVIQTRIFAEKLSKKIMGEIQPTMTFDDILNSLKDRIKTQREKEFIEDLFFIKKQGNACAHGEETTAIICLEVLHHAFEAAINYSYFKKNDENVDKLTFDDTLLITEKKSSDTPLIEKYLERAQMELSKEEILNKKQGEFLSQTDKQEDEETSLKDRNSIKNPKKYKEKNPKKEKIKEKIKHAQKTLKENINKLPKKQKKSVEIFPKNERKTKPKASKKVSKRKAEKNFSNKQIKSVLFIIFVLISILLLFKLIF